MSHFKNSVPSLLMNLILALIIAVPALAAPEDEIAEIATAAKEGPNGYCNLLLEKVQDTEQFKQKLAGMNIQEFARNTNEADQELSFGMQQGGFEYLERGLARGEDTDETFRDFVGNRALIHRLTEWELSLIPRESFRKVGLLENLTLKSFDVISLEVKPFFLNKPLPSSDFSDWRPIVQDKLDFLKANASADSADSVGKPRNVELAVLCAQYGVLTALDCVQSLKRILEWMTPYSAPIRYGNLEVSAVVTMPDRIAEFVLDWNNHEALRRAAATVWDSLADKDALPADNFFDIVADSYRAVGLSDEESIERTWNFMAIYSTRGANIGPTIGHFVSGTPLSTIAATFSILAHGTGILDARGLRLGKGMFSYPKGVVSTVDNSKPYHFWMAAYLARQSGREVNSPEAGKDAAWLAQLGYQMKSTTNGRDPNRAFAVDPFSAANNKIRMDLTYAAAGAQYGKQSLKSSRPEVKYDIDAAFRNLLNSGEALQPLSATEASDLWSGTGKNGYFRWRRIFNPDAALDFFD